MSTAEDVQAWFDAVQLYEAGIVGEAIEKFREVTQSAKILFDIGCCYLTLNDIKAAAEQYEAAVGLDSHSAIGFFMLGLTDIFLEKYDDSMNHFKKSLDLLRGNRCVDYRQLGFKYQLYSCEILTNQAVVAFHQNKMEKAKGLLLQAVGCQAERKHEGIADSLSLLQSGFPISPFSPPQSEIFRPPKAAVANLKKKNYLGKAKVISTENTEEIYACFSGIKDQKAPAKPDRNRPKPTDRKKLLTELRMPERKKTLRLAPRTPNKQLPELGHVIETSPRKVLPQMPQTRPPPLKALPAGPVDMNNNERVKPAPRKSLPSAPTIMLPVLPEPRSVPTIPPDEDETYEPISPTGSESSNMQVEDSSDAEEFYEAIDENELFESIRRSSVPVFPSSRPRIPSSPIPTRRPVVPIRQTSENVLGRERSYSNSLTKPERAPPLPPPKDGTDSQPESMVAPPRKFYPRQNSDSGVVKEMKNILKNSMVLPCPISPYAGRKNNGAKSPYTARKNSDATSPLLNRQNIPSSPYPGRKNSSPADLDVRKWKKKQTLTPLSPTEPVLEIDVQYTFVKKVKMQAGMTLQQVLDIVKAESVPDEIELCYTDDLGRQQTVNEKKLPMILEGKKKLFCFPEGD